MKIWIDLTNTPHVNVLLPIIEHLAAKHQLIISARDFSETVPLLQKNRIPFILVGKYDGRSRTKKVLGFIAREFKLLWHIPSFDISFSLGGNYTTTISKLRRKPSIVFSDNDISFKSLAYQFGTYFILPTFFNADKLKRSGVKNEQIFQFNGFKEDIYIASYSPNPGFLSKIPFQNFITIRPENLKASYVPLNSKTIVPQLFEVFKNENILFLPRYPEEVEYAKDYHNIFIPDEPLNGLDVCYYSKAMLTGAGTFAREAALLGTPAVSFFPGEKFLSVDIVMKEKGMEFISRNPHEIFNFVLKAKKRISQQEMSKQVFSEVIGIIEKIIAKQIK